MRHRLDELLASWLPEGSLYSVGGRVRDEFRAELNEEPEAAKDLDYVVVGVPAAGLAERLARLGRAAERER